MLVSSISLSTLGLVCSLPLQGGCSGNIGSTPADGGPGEAAPVPTPNSAPTTLPGASDAGAVPPPPGAGPLGFTPSNISLSGINLSKIADEDVSRQCTIQTGTGGYQDCFSYGVSAVVSQSDGSKVEVIVVKSLTLEPAGRINVTGGLPLALVSLGDMTLLGPIDANAARGAANAGGFSAQAGGQIKGAGPGGGPASTGTTFNASAAAGGGSYCGRGGQGGVESTATGQAAAPTASYGTTAIVPLLGGSSGGNGGLGSGAGGGALQLVARGTLSLGAAGHINVGGGGGTFGGPGIIEEASGGGSGGSLLIEAPIVKIAGALAANGGGGGSGYSGTAYGQDATPDAIAAGGGAGGSTGGAGAASASIDGANGLTGAVTSDALGSGGEGGGGGAGRIRINTMTGSADLPGATISPDMSTSCATQGKVASL